MTQNRLTYDADAATKDWKATCDEWPSLSNILIRYAPLHALQHLLIHCIVLWLMFFMGCSKVQSFFHDENDASVSLQHVTLSDSSQRRQIQSTSASSTIQAYAAIRINAGGEIEYNDKSGKLWGADEWYEDKGRRTTPSECTKSIFNTTDDILYCSNRFYPVSMFKLPYRYTIPLPYSALYEVRLHFAEVIFDSVGSRVFTIFIDGKIAIENLDVFAQAGALNAYVHTTQVFVSDRTITIQFSPVVNDPFIAAIEVLEIPNITAPITIATVPPTTVPNSSPSGALPTEAVRINAGGKTFVDSLGQTWAMDTFFRGNSFVNDRACMSGTDILNTTDDTLFCAERYFKGSEVVAGYEIPLSYRSKYQVHLYFSENYFNKSGSRLFDIVVEEEDVIKSFDVLGSAGGPLTMYMISTVVNVSDGFLSLHFFPKINFPTINAIEILKLSDLTTAASVSPSLSPTLDSAGLAASNCSAYPSCVSVGFVGSCCPLANGTIRECCFGISPQTPAPSALSIGPSQAPSDIVSYSPSVVPIMLISSEPSILRTSPEPMEPSLQDIIPSFQQAPQYDFNKTVVTVIEVTMVIGQNDATFEGGLASETNCTILWKDAITRRIEAEVPVVLPTYETIKINLFDVIGTSNLSHITITCDVIVESRLAVRDVDVNRLITGPFDSQSEKISFIQYLATTSCPEFHNIATIEIIIANETIFIGADRANEPDGDNRFFFGLFIVVGVGSGAILLTTFIRAYVRAQNRRKVEEIDCMSMAPANTKEYQIESTPAEIENSQEGTDISTLGDPIICERLMQKTDDDTLTLGSGGEEYDYKKAYMDMESTADCESNIGDSSIAELHITEGNCQSLSHLDDLQSVNDILSNTGESDCVTIFCESEYSVKAPPGLLGLILESSSIHGRPIVNSVKPFSVLANRVSVGDQLVSVNNEDVSTQTANKLSQLIASQQNEVRILTFKRRIINGSSGAC